MQRTGGLGRPAGRREVVVTAAAVLLWLATAALHLVAFAGREASVSGGRFTLLAALMLVALPVVYARWRRDRAPYPRSEVASILFLCVVCDLVVVSEWLWSW